MNQTAIKAMLNSANTYARLYAAFRKTAILGHSVAHIPNSKGHVFMAVRWDRIKGFTITDKQGHNITRLVFNELRAV